MSNSEASGPQRERQSLLGAGRSASKSLPSFPCSPVRDLVVFPGVTVPLSVGRAKSLAALERAGSGGFLIVATQREAGIEDPGVDDLHPMGCVARVMRVIDARQESKQAIVVGVARTRLGPALAESPALLMRLDPVPDIEGDAAARDAMWKRVVELAQRVIDLHDDYPDEWKGFVAGIPSAGLLADVISSTLPLPPEEKLALLAEPDAIRRLERIARHLEREATIAEAQRALSRQAGAAEIDPQQRERLLRRRMRDIEGEIGDSDAGHARGRGAAREDRGRRAARPPRRRRPSASCSGSRRFRPTPPIAI